ncbi:apolipoprotein D [Eurytemora carolleeae]|uniref:apolipoprotein D n=1 Tax=Eurytemora carolleeae TaxID=1294199 RepID=UPI000C7853BA|nr:apolipoprotein D [Eurytemora carolleeae]|eukprot:XP_023334392.1 apolipoprotein D-like [Eurytemora affinis]
MLIIVALSGLFCVASAGPMQSFLGGIRAQCPPKPPTVSTLDAAAYLGKWYEQKRIPASFQLNTRCVRAEYGLNDEGVITVHNTATKQDGSFDEIFGTATVPDPNHPGELKVHFPESPVDGDYWILDTDYENYSIVYSCVDYIFGLIHFEFAWILARDTNMDPALIQKGVDLLESYGIDISLLEDTVQTEDCFYG